jgi:hypothetical protein
MRPEHVHLAGKKGLFGFLVAGRHFGQFRAQLLHIGDTADRGKCSSVLEGRCGNLDFNKLRLVGHG